MSADHDFVKQLQKSRNRWRALAIASLILVFVGLFPFTVVMNEVNRTLWSKKGTKTIIAAVTYTTRAVRVKQPAKDETKSKVDSRPKGDSGKSPETK